MKRKRISEDESVLPSNDVYEQEKKRPRPDSGTINQEESPESIHLTWIRRELALKPEEVVPDSDPLSYTSIFNFSLDAEPSRNPRLIAASFESSDYLPSPSLQTSTMNRQNDRNPIHSGKQKARPLTRSSDTRHVRIDEVIPDSDPDSILSIDTLPSPRLIMASFEPNSRFSSDHKMTQSQKHGRPSSVISPSYMPLPPSSPSSESGMASCGSSPRSGVDFSAFEPCTRPPSPYLHLNTAQGPIATKSSGERTPMAVTKQFSHPAIAVLNDSQSPKPRRISKLAPSLVRDAIPALRQSSVTIPSLSLSPIEPPANPKTLVPPNTHEEVPNLTTGSETNGSTITSTSTSTTTTAVAGNSEPGDTQARARTLVTHQLMSLLCAKLGDALTENNYVGISAIASRGVEALGLLL